MTALVRVAIWERITQGYAWTEVERHGAPAREQVGSLSGSRLGQETQKRGVYK